MTNYSHGDEPARTNIEQSNKVFGPIDRALACLNGMSSFLAFEKLEGLSSHQSHIFHDLAIHRAFGLVSAWKPELSASENDENTARLLVDLNANGLKSIQLLDHLNEQPDVAPARAFFFYYGYDDSEKKRGCCHSAKSTISQQSPPMNPIRSEFLTLAAAWKKCSTSAR